MNVQSLFDQAVLHQQNRRLAEAESLYRQILAREPAHAPAQLNLAVALRESGQNLPALEAYRRAIELNPQNAPAHLHCGGLLFELDEPVQAEAMYRRAIALAKQPAMTHVALGNALAAQLRIDDAMSEFRRAIALEPDDALAHFQLASLLLLQGNMEEGWREYEWRVRVADSGIPAVRFSEPPARANNLAGKRIFVYAEQGAGDAIQFARFVPMLAERGAQPVLAVPPELFRLFTNLKGTAQLLTRGHPRPEFDAHVSLLSLPNLLEVTWNDLPAKVPYLSPRVDDQARWQHHVNQEKAKLNVGLAWSGNPAMSVNRLRSTTLESLAPLSGIEGVTFYSLQKGIAAEQAKHAPAGMKLIDPSARLEDFADTAALMNCLDLIVTVDTSIAHLAGALGKPTWVLLAHLPDWRWLLERNDSPWYPTMRLFRQPAINDWATPIAEAAAALKALGVGR